MLPEPRTPDAAAPQSVAGVARPRPGGRAGPAAPAAQPAPTDGLQTLAARPGSGATGFITPAMPLLQLMARLRTMATQPDPADLRARTEAEMHAFQARAEAAGLPAEQIRRAHYALCASLDDLVLNTPWGSSGAWAEQTLVAGLHPAVGAARFFDVLRQVEDKVENFQPVLELMVVCLSLGMQGCYRGAPDGAAELERLRAAAASLLASRAPLPPVELAATWRGVAAPFSPRRAGIPLWVAASLGLAALAAWFLLLSLRLNDRSDALFAAMLAAPPAAMPAVTREPLAAPPPAPPTPDLPPADQTLADRLARRLQPAIAAGQIAIAGSPTTPILRLPASALFAANGAAMVPEAIGLLQSVAAAVEPEIGRLQVAGYTDDRPVHTVLFPSNFQLSLARARAVGAVLGHAIAGAHITAVGRASADPLASNATQEGREQNRRVDILLVPPAT